MTVVIVLYRTWSLHKFYQHHPGPTRESFLTGNYYTMKAAQNKNQLFDLILQWSIDHGKTFIFWRFNKEKWFTTDPSIIRSMLTELTIFQKAKTIPNRTLFSQRITGTSSFLTVIDGNIWAHKRKVMSAYFTKIHMNTLYEKLKGNLRTGLDTIMTRRLEKSPEVDLVDMYGELYQYFLGALGLDLNCGLVSGNSTFHNHCIQRILKWAPLQLQTPLKNWQLKRDPEVIETIDLVTQLRAIGRRILEEKEIELQNTGTDPHDIVHLILNANRILSEDANVRMEYQMDDMMTLFLVIDNMGKTLSNLFVEVLRRPEVYRRMVKEAREADTSSLLSLDQSLRYTELVILEILRIHPTLMRGIRVLSEATTLNGLPIKKSALIFFGQLVLHKHPDYWERPEEFIPERFANGTAGIEPFTYLPFVAGPRVCMGKHLAMLSMKLAIVETLKNFDMKPVPGTEKDIDFDLRFTIVRATKGHIVNIDRVV